MSKKNIYGGLIAFTLMLQGPFHELRALEQIVTESASGIGIAGSLHTCINNINAFGSDSSNTITISSGVTTISLTESLPRIVKPINFVTQSQSPVTIDGLGTYNGFAISKGPTALNNLTIQNMLAKGRDAIGATESGYCLNYLEGMGGGGDGGGAGVFIDSPDPVTINTCSIVTNKAQGGNGGSTPRYGVGQSCEYIAYGAEPSFTYPIYDGVSFVSKYPGGGNGGNFPSAGQWGGAGGLYYGGTLTTPLTSYLFGGTGGGWASPPTNAEYSGGGGGGSAYGAGLFVMAGSVVNLVDSSYGTTTIENNTLQVGQGGLNNYGQFSGYPGQTVECADIFLMNGAVLNVENNFFPIVIKSLGGGVWKGTEPVTNVALNKNGSQLLTLYGLINYLGQTTISAGNLQIGQSTDTSSNPTTLDLSDEVYVGTGCELIIASSQNVNFGGTYSPSIVGLGSLQINQGSSFTFLPNTSCQTTITGPGSLSIAENALWTLPQNCTIYSYNSYNTTNSEGQPSTDGSIDVNQYTLTFNLANNSGFSGSIYSSANNTGAFNLYQESTTFSLNGDLDVAYVDFFGGTTKVAATSVITAPANSSTAFGVAVNANGSSPATLTGLATVAETATIDANIYLGPNTALTGNFIVSGNIQVSGGSNGATITPGSSPGKIQAKDISFEKGSSLQIHIGENYTSILSADNLFFEPRVNLGFRFDPGFYQERKKYSFLEFTNLYGFADKISTNSVVLQPVVSFEEGKVVVSFKYNQLASFTNQRNAQNFGESLNKQLSSGIVKSEVIKTIMSKSVLANADQIGLVLDTLQPANIKSLALCQENNIVKVEDSLSRRMISILDLENCCENENDRRFHFWLDGWGDILHQKSTTFYGSQQTGYTNRTGAFTAGFDFGFLNTIYAGILTGYTGSTIDWFSGIGNGDIDTGYAGLYLSGILDMYYVNLSVIGGWSGCSAKTYVFLPENKIGLNSSIDTKQILSHIDLGINWTIGKFTLRPFDSFDYISQTDAPFSQKYKGMSVVDIDQNNSIMLRNELGLEMSFCACFKKANLMIDPKFSWVREVRVKGKTIKANLADSQNTFEVIGYFPDRSLFSPGVVLASSFFNDLMYVSLYYNGEFGSKFNDQTYGGQIRFGF